MPPLIGATIEYEFNQGTLADQFQFEEAEDGVCAGLVINWLLEKMSTSNGFRASIARAFGGGTSRSFYGAATPGRQEAVLRSGRRAQQAYEAAGLRTMRYSLAEAGLQVDDATTGHANTSSLNPSGALVMGRGDANRPVARVVESLVQAASEFLLSKGCGLIVGITLDRGGHTVGIYRSHGSNIHFFDPNIGVFKVRDLSAFLESWLDYYRFKSITVRLDTRDETFIYVR
jgi:hypothetical protein